jgi:hypothetical protein
MPDASNLLPYDPSPVFCNNQLWRSWARKMHAPNPWLLCMKVCCKIPGFLLHTFPSWFQSGGVITTFFFKLQWTSTLLASLWNYPQTLSCYVRSVLCNYTDCKLFLQIFENGFVFSLPLLAILETIELLIKYPQTGVLAPVLPKLGVWSKVRMKNNTQKKKKKKKRGDQTGFLT